MGLLSHEKTSALETIKEASTQLTSLDLREMWLKLEQNVKSEGREHPANGLIPIKEVVTVEHVFQPRDSGTKHAQAAQVRNLRKSLRNGQQMEPIQVLSIGDCYVVIAGHLRLQAHQGEQRDEIPAALFPGTFDEALAASASDNVRDKMPLTKDEKLNSAWSLVVHHSAHFDQTGEKLYSNVDIIRASNVSKNLPKKMAERYAKLKDKHSVSELLGMTWRQARSSYEMDDNFDAETAREKRVERWVNDLGKVIGKRYPKEADYIGEALERLSPTGFSAMMESLEGWETERYNSQEFNRNPEFIRNPHYVREDEEF